MRETARYGGIAVLAVLALAFAASTLDSATTSGSGDTGFGGQGGGFGATANVSPVNQSAGGSIPLLDELVTALVLIALIASIAYFYLDFWGAVKTVALVFGALALVGLVLWMVSQFVTEGSPAEIGGRGLGNLSLGTEGGDLGSGESAPESSPVVVLIAALIAIVALARIASRRVGRSDSETGIDEEPADAAAIGRAAGRAADRLEADAAVENEVYRTWAEMTDLLDVADPETSTPGEFAAAATEAGLGREDVGKLTRLFEDVRYGNLPASEDRERSAVELFRRIEDRYAEAES